nr:hypothetical protein [Tanacetum cinerariifolium]
DDPPLGVYIESKFPVNSEPLELLTFSPLLAKFCSNHDPVLVVSLAGKTIQDTKKFEQWVDLLHMFQTPDVRVPPSDS